MLGATVKLNKLPCGFRALKYFSFFPFCLIICVISAPEIHESKQQNMPLHCLNIVTPRVLR